jgi:hypothetical protein
VSFVILVGLILLAAAVVAAVEFIIANQGTVVLRMWDWTWNIDAFWLGVAGAVTVAVAAVGLAMLAGASGRSRRLRRERRDLAAENRRLAEQAERADQAEVIEPVPAWNAPAAAYRNPPGTGYGRGYAGQPVPQAGEQPLSTDSPDIAAEPQHRA